MAKNDKNINKAWLDSALSECAVALEGMLKNEQAAIAKSAKDDAPVEESSGSEGPTAPESSDEPDGDEGPPMDEASAPAEGPADDAGAPPAPEASAPDAGAAPGQEQAIAPAPTVEALQAEYSKLDPEALKMHYLAAKSALMAVMGAEQGAGAPPGAEASAPAAPPAAAPPAPPAGAPMAMGEMKSGKQVNLTDGNGGEVEAGKLGKAEKEIADLRGQLSTQTEEVAKLAKAVEVLLQPVRKSVKGVSDLKFIGRTEDAPEQPAANLSKKEVQSQLRDKVREGKLSKADKELISQYSVGAVDITKIQHLLASAK